MTKYARIAHSSLNIVYFFRWESRKTHFNKILSYVIIC